jgi:hypothetical protein
MLLLCPCRTAVVVFQVDETTVFSVKSLNLHSSSQAQVKIRAKSNTNTLLLFFFTVQKIFLLRLFQIFEFFLCRNHQKSGAKIDRWHVLRNNLKNHTMNEMARQIKRIIVL